MIFESFELATKRPSITVAWLTSYLYLFSLLLYDRMILRSSAFIENK